MLRLLKAVFGPARRRSPWKSPGMGASAFLPFDRVSKRPAERSPFQWWNRRDSYPPSSNVL